MATDITQLLQQILVDAAVDLFDGGVLEIRSGAPPGAGAADAGTLLVSITLPTPAFGAASGGDPASAAKNGTWEDASADAAGTAGHYRIKQSGDAGGSGEGTEERIEGTVTQTGSGGDLELDNDVIAAGQTVTITTFTVTHP